MSQATQVPETRSTPRWIWIVLIVSLGGNLLVLGGAIGAIWHFRHSRGTDIIGAPHHFNSFISKLSREKQAALRALLRAQRNKQEPLFLHMRQARRKVVDAFVADPFDKERFATLNRQLTESRSRLKNLRSELYPKLVSILSLSERKAFVRWRRHSHARWRHRWRRH